MRYALDTNACIVYLKHRHTGIRERLETTPTSDIALLSIVKAELLTGARKYADPEARLAQLRAFFAPFPSLPFDDRAAEVYGEIRAYLEAVGTPIGPHDLMVAAIALANNLIVVTHNTGEFSRVPGLRIEDWEA